MADESTPGRQPHDGEATSILSAFADQSLETVAKQQATERQRAIAEGEDAQAAKRPTNAPQWNPDDPVDSIDGDDGRIPPGLLIAAVAAIVLLSFGGYGIVKERSELREEITRLQAELAVPVRPSAGNAETRLALRRIEQRNDELRATIATLKQENQRLQASLAEQQSAAAEMTDSTAGNLKTQEPVTNPVALVAAAEPANTIPVEPITDTAVAGPSSPANAGANDTWFVNFSSYSQRANAQSWADRLTPESGRVTVVPGVRNNRTYYRVRVVDLESKAAASQVARQLEREHKLSGLWVGTD